MSNIKISDKKKKNDIFTATVSLGKDKYDIVVDTKNYSLMSIKTLNGSNPIHKDRVRSEIEEMLYSMKHPDMRRERAVALWGIYSGIGLV